jgi:hypothetical protein
MVQTLWLALMAEKAYASEQLPKSENSMRVRVAGILLLYGIVRKSQ